MLSGDDRQVSRETVIEGEYLCKVLPKLDALTVLSLELVALHGIGATVRSCRDASLLAPAAPRAP